MSAEVLSFQSELLVKQLATYAAALDQRDDARAIAVQLEQECAEQARVIAVVRDIAASYTDDHTGFDEILAASVGATAGETQR